MARSSSGLASVADLRKRHRAGDRNRQHPATDVHRPARPLRDVADVHLRLHATRRPCRKRARPSAQLPNGLHEPHQPIPLLEHELPRGTPHVPAGALPQPRPAPRAGESRHAEALFGPIGGVAGDHSRRLPAVERPHVLRPTEAADADPPRRRRRQVAHLHCEGPAR